MRRNIVPFVVAALAAWCALGAQGLPEEDAVPTFAPEAPAEDDIVAPTRVRVGVRDGRPVVRWVDHDAATGYLVYRHDAPIDSARFDEAVVIGRVPQGLGSFEDAPELDGNYFYAVLALDADGDPVVMLEPMRNATVTGLPVTGVPKTSEESSAPQPVPGPVAVSPDVPATSSVSPAAAPAAAPEPTAVPTTPRIAATTPPPTAGSTAPSSAPRAPVRSIAALARDDAIRVSWIADAPGSRLVLYRGVAPIVDVASLLVASTVASFQDREGFILDYPVPGIPYYYAIVDDEGLRTGRIVVSRGSNATTVAAEIPAGRYRVGLPDAAQASRSIPLPYLYLSRSVSPDGKPLLSSLELPPRVPLSAAGEKVASELLGYAVTVPAEAPELVVLPEDRVLQGSGDEYTLRLIAAERLLKEDWKAAADELSRYLSIRRDPSLEARARFYRGQALAMLGEERDAFFELLLAEPWVGGAGDAWVDWLLGRLRTERVGD
ncbi:MAG: hypothetical protein JXA15_02185 [Spirochaetales bacterium]|nr:hypothetical protein [Spirochaetales bacterium]